MYILNVDQQHNISQQKHSQSATRFARMGLIRQMLRNLNNTDEPHKGETRRRLIVLLLCYIVLLIYQEYVHVTCAAFP